MLGVFAKSFDKVVGTAILKRGGRTEAEAQLGAEARIYALQQILPQYEGVDARFFDAPGPAAPRVDRLRNQLDLRWYSNYTPFNPDVSAEYLAHTRNHNCEARLLLRRGGAKGTVVLLHGYLGGAHALERQVWPVRRLHKAGYHLALFVLPFHGRRRPPLTAPIFPGSDPRITIEGFRQAVHDLRRFIGWLDREGYGPASVMGMSLGGYTSALLSTVEPRLRAVVPIIPLASIARFARDRGRFVGSREQQERQQVMIERIYRPVSPLARPSLTARRLVVAGEADRICPMAHAELLADHFDCELVTFRGGHLMQLGRGRAFDRIIDLLEA